MSDYSVFSGITEQIIKELGPIGLLVVGLYYVLGQHMKKICKHLEHLNHNSDRGLDVVERCTERICDKLDGKN